MTTMTIANAGRVTEPIWTGGDLATDAARGRSGSPQRAARGCKATHERPFDPTLRAQDSR
jgi:hypothetical protein